MKEPQEPSEGLAECQKCHNYVPDFDPSSVFIDYDGGEHSVDMFLCSDCVYELKELLDKNGFTELITTIETD